MPSTFFVLTRSRNALGKLSSRPTMRPIFTLRTPSCCRKWSQVFSDHGPPIWPIVYPSVPYLECIRHSLLPKDCRELTSLFDVRVGRPTHNGDHHCPQGIEMVGSRKPAQESEWIRKVCLCIGIAVQKA